MRTKQVRNMLSRELMLSCLLLACLVFSGCIHCREVAWREFKVFCGMSYQGGEVTEGEWQSFCDKHVTTVFPEGYTSFEATGYWKGKAERTVRENSRVLLIVAPADAKDKVLSIAREYREQFHQEAVLVLISNGDAVFVEAGQ